jgi:hypothetical protein
MAIFFLIYFSITRFLCLINPLRAKFDLHLMHMCIFWDQELYHEFIFLFLVFQDLFPRKYYLWFHWFHSWILQSFRLHIKLFMNFFNQCLTNSLYPYFHFNLFEDLSYPVIKGFFLLAKCISLWIFLRSFFLWTNVYFYAISIHQFLNKSDKIFVSFQSAYHFSFYCLNWLFQSRNQSYQ